MGVAAHAKRLGEDPDIPGGSSQMKSVLARCEAAHARLFIF